MIFQQMKPGTSVIHNFHVILTEQFICCIIFQDSRSPSRSKIKFQGQVSRKTIFQQMKPGTFVIPLFHGILTEKSNNNIFW